MTTNPVRAKVLAATTGAGAGAALGSFLLWLLGVLAFGGQSAAGAAADTVAAVPAPVSAIVLTVVSALAAFISGYIKSETPPVLEAEAPTMHGGY